MGIVNTTVQTIKCDAPGCDKLITFAAPEGEQIIKNTPWLRTARTIIRLIPHDPQQAPKSFTYCSDVCEVNGVKTGEHNLPEPKLIQMPTGDAQSQIRAAVQAVEAQRAGEAALREGKPVNIQPAS